MRTFTSAGFVAGYDTRTSYDDCGCSPVSLYSLGAPPIARVCAFSDSLGRSS